MTSWTLGDDNFKVLVTATQVGSDVVFTYEILAGSGNVNALYWGDAINDGGAAVLQGAETGVKVDSKSLNALNMNGSGEDFDYYHAFSNAGLKGATVGTVGDTGSFTWTGGSLADIYDIGIRATSTSTDGGSVKLTSHTPDTPPPSVDFPEYDHAYSNVVFYLDPNGVDTDGGIIKVKVDFDAGTDVHDLNNTDVYAWLNDNYLDGSPNSYTLLAYTIHAGDEAILPDGTHEQIVGPVGPGQNPLHPGEGPTLWLTYGPDGNDTVSDYTDTTKAAGPTAPQPLLDVGITDQVLAAGYDAEFHYHSDGTVTV